jgi:DNA-binding NarL/FixJ family response regulator
VARGNILLADFQAVVRSGLRSWFEQALDFLVIHEVESAAELKNLLTKGFIDVVVLDHLTLPNFDITELAAIQNQFQNTAFIILSGDQDNNNILKILSMGISGYVTKSCSKEEIIQAVQNVASGEKFFCHKVINLLIDVRTKKEEDNTLQNLTDRETEIVRLIAEGHSTMQIASLLNLSHHTINSHRKNILRKLKIKSPVELVVYAMNTGIIIQPQ